MMSRKRKNYNLLLAIICTLFLSGCVTTGHQFSESEAPPADQSIVYFYRTNELVNNSTSPGILHNGVQVLPLMTSGGFWKYYISPGVHIFGPQQFGHYKKETFALTNDRPGQIYYVEMVLSADYIGLEMRSESEAMETIAKCNELTGNTDGRNLAGTKAIAANANMVESPPPGMATIHVTTSPQNSRIRIMNIKPKFQQDMVLSPGKYHLEVSAKGFQTRSKWVSLSKGEVGSFNVNLQPKKK